MSKIFFMALVKEMEKTNEENIEELKTYANLCSDENKKLKCKIDKMRRKIDELEEDKRILMLAIEKLCSN